jgi:hypothetical protein
MILTGCGGGGDGGGGAGSGSGSGLELNTRSITFRAGQDGPTPAPQSVLATLSTSDADYILAGYPPGVSEASWLNIDLYGSGSQWTFEFRITTTSLPEGSYSTTVRIVCLDGDEAVIAYRDLTVELTIDNRLHVTPPDLVFNHIDGSTTLPADQTVQINGDQLSWTAQADRTWVRLESTNGVTPSSLTIGVEPSALTPGAHTATVTITDGTDTVDLDITLEVDVAQQEETPEFHLGATRLTFDGINGAAIAPQSLTVELNNGGTINWIAESGDAWLVLDKSAGTTPDVISVSVDPAAGGLSSGTYTSTINLSGSYEGAPLSAVIPVQLDLAAPEITVNTGSMTFSGINGAAIAAQPLTVELNNSGTIAWRADSGDAWLLLDKSAGTTPDVISVSVDPAAGGLSSGTYTSTINLSGSYEGAPLSAVVPVQLDLAAPEITVNTGSMTFSGINGAEIAAQLLDVGLNNGDDIAWAASSSHAWLLLDKSSGTTPDSVSVSADPAAAGLPSGAYSASITITGTYRGDPLSADIPVQLNLTAPVIMVNPAHILLGGEEGTDPNPESLFQFSLPTGANAYLWNAVLSTHSGGSWLLADTTSGTVSSSSTEMNLSVDRSMLSGGIYEGTLTLSATVNGDTVTADVPVTLNAEHHNLFVADNGVAFASTPSISKLTHTVVVQDSYGLTTTPWSASSNESWLTVTPSGATGDDLTLTVDSSGLVEDTVYLATVTISSTAGTIENAETVRVGLWVGSTAPSDAIRVETRYQVLLSDPIRPYAYVHNAGSEITVYNIYTGSEVTTITNAAGQLGPMVAGSDGSYLYVADLNSDQIVPVRLDTLAVETPWNLTSSPTHMHLAYARPGNRPLLFASDGRAYDAADGTRFNAGFKANNLIAASPDGTALFLRTLGTSPGSITRYDITYSALETDGLAIRETANLREPGYGSDLAVSADGMQVYTASKAPYVFHQYNGTTLSIDETLTADAYPNNVEIGPNGLFYGAISSSYGPTDVWVYDDTHTELNTHYLSGYADEILDRQLALSGDGLRLMVLTTDPTLQFVTGP